MTSSGQMGNKSQQPDSDYKSLPESYGNTEAALLPRDPNWMFIYWEITDNSKANIAKEHGHDVFEKARHVLRVYDVTTADSKVHLYDKAGNPWPDEKLLEKHERIALVPSKKELLLYALPALEDEDEE